MENIKREEICRTCLNNKGKMHLLFNDKPYDQLAEQLNTLTQLRVMPGDGFPEQICHSCFTLINKTFKFIEKCRDSDTTLRQKLDYIDNISNKKDKSNDSHTFPTLDSKETNLAHPVQHDHSDQHTGNNKPRSVRKRIRKNHNKDEKQNYVCPQCNKELKTYASLKYHMQLHSDKNPYLCYECGDSFKTKNSYDGHMATHDINKSLTCDECGKRYRQAASLRNHKMTHTGERPYLCMVCGKGCIQKSDFKKHMLTHTNEKSYVCNICGQRYRFSNNLKLHLRTHTGEKPYECTICNKRFSAKDLLKRHSIIHTGEKPYKCNFCWKSFNRQSTLVVHTKLHTGQRDHICNICGKGFIQAHCLLSHMNTHKKTESMAKSSEIIQEVIVTQVEPSNKFNDTESVIRVVLTDEQTKQCEEITNFINVTEMVIEPDMHMPPL